MIYVMYKQELKKIVPKIFFIPFSLSAAPIFALTLLVGNSEVNFRTLITSLK